jgi:hypothetical protein
LREKARMRGIKRQFSLFYSPHPDPLQQEREIASLNLMAVRESLGM